MSIDIVVNISKRPGKWGEWEAKNGLENVL